MGCNASGNAQSTEPVSAVEVGAPRERPEISDDKQFQEREHEEQLASITDSIPPEIAKKLSRKVSIRKRSEDDLSEKKRLSTASVRKVDSQADFAAASQTIIIFDWDDTLCPSTAMRPFGNFDRNGHLRAKLSSETKNELKMLSDVVIPLLRTAQTLGKVILVTNAKSPWVDMSCQHYLPSLQALMKDIPIIYALELVKANGGLEGFDKDTGCLLTETKARAMREAVTKFYSQYPGQSWKNIVSIGDAFFEHDAIRQVVGEKKQEKPCRTKTIKLLEGPTIAGLVVQLSIVNTWLPKITRANHHVEIDLNANEETVNQWVELYGDLNESPVLEAAPGTAAT